MYFCKQIYHFVKYRCQFRITILNSQGTVSRFSCFSSFLGIPTHKITYIIYYNIIYNIKFLFDFSLLSF